MADLVVIVPTRERPDAARELVHAFADTCAADTFLAFAVDEDDPARAEYEALVDGRSTGIVLTPSRTMVEALNQAAVPIAATTGAFAVGFMGDDHRPRTVGWDQAYLDALREMGTGIVYGDDRAQGRSLPTQCAMTADIVQALGFMALPTLRHLYVDNFWRDLGRAAGCLRYLPGVVVEHVHPFAGKAEMDAGYERVNAPEVYSADRAAYAAYQSGPMHGDVAKVRELRLPDGHLTVPFVDEHEWRLFAEGTVPEYTRPEWYAGRKHAPHLEEGGHRARLLTTATLAAQAAFAGKLSTVVDLGSGDGGPVVAARPGAEGVGLRPDAGERRGGQAARRRCPVRRCRRG
jgi:hypothetical protein